MRFCVFVYGTLKRGERNFAAHCFDAVRISEAWLWGRLFKRHTGTPILSVPAESILGFGTAGAEADVRLQHSAIVGCTNEYTAADRWVRVRGELMEFADIAPAVERLDALEGFRYRQSNISGGGDNLYERFLVPLGNNPSKAVWTYAIPRNRREADYATAPDPTWWKLDW